MLKKKTEEAIFVHFDDLMKIYSGDYLYVEDVMEYFDLLEVILCIFNMKSEEFHMIRTRLDRTKYWEMICMKGKFVYLNRRSESLKFVEKRCQCCF